MKCPMKVKIAAMVGASAVSIGCGVENSQLRLRTAMDAGQTRSQLDRCYERELAANPRAGGAMRVIVHVPVADGRVDDVEVLGGEAASHELAECVRSALIGLPIGAPPMHADLAVEYTLEFAPRG